MAVSKTIAVILIAAGLCSVAVIGGVYALTASYHQDDNEINISSDYLVVDLMDSAGTSSISSKQVATVDNYQVNTVKTGGTVTYSWSAGSATIGTYKIKITNESSTAVAGKVNLKITDVGTSLDSSKFTVSYTDHADTSINSSTGVDLDITNSGLDITLKYVVDGKSDQSSPLTISSNNTFKIVLTYVASS